MPSEAESISARRISSRSTTRCCGRPRRARLAGAGSGDEGPRSRARLARLPRSLRPRGPGPSRNRAAAQGPQTMTAARALFAVFLALAATGALAHKPSDSYLAIRVEGGSVSGQWDIALRDLDFAIGIDDNGDGDITWGELKAHHGGIAAYALARLKLRSGGADCPVHATEFLADDHSDGAYSVMRFQRACPVEAATIQISYSLFADLDPQHKGLLRLEHGSGTRTGIFSPERATQAFQLEKISALTQFFDYAREGVWHIWIGYDHILFLLSLLLPAGVLVRGGRGR